MNNDVRNRHVDISRALIVTDHVMIRRSNAEYFAVVSNGEVEPRAAVGAVPSGRHAWSDSGILAVPSRRVGKQGIWRQVRLCSENDGRFDSMGGLETPGPITDVAWIRDRLVACGISRHQARAWVISPFEETPQWCPLALPEALHARRKSFDALAISGATLVAIDNLVFPKWMVMYSAKAGNVPAVQAVLPMVVNGPNEHVEAARSGRRVFVVKSCTVGMFQRVKEHWVVYRFDSGEAVGGIAVDGPVIDVAMHGDDLWVLIGGCSPALLCYRGLDQLTSFVPPDFDDPTVSKSTPELLTDERIALSRPFDQLRRTRVGDLVIGSAERDEFVLLQGDASTWPALLAAPAIKCN